MEDENNHSSLYVPEDALMEILARLPVESLLRFLCVCKSWYALIKNPNFITTHINYNYASSDDKASRIVVIDENYDDPHITTVLSNEGVEIYHDLPNSFLSDINNNSIGRLELSNSCNGVICVCDYSGPDINRVALWNPAIREVNSLVLDDGIANGCEVVHTMFGFGINTKTNVYKVVRCRKFKSFLDQHFVVDIYDVGSKNDSWRKLDDINLPMPITWNDGGSVYVDGFCYWLVGFKSDYQFILSFDFINEVFERIQKPPEATRWKRYIMARFGESLAFVGRSWDHDFQIVFMLNRDGNKITWCKQFLLPTEDAIYPRFLRSGKVALLCPGGEVLLYDPRSQECKKLMDVTETYAVEIMNYVESLVSFKKYFPPFPNLQISDCESLHNRQG